MTARRNYRGIIIVINKGCNFRVAIYDEINTIEIVGYIVDKFNGELL